jgi:capsule polysaccharide export protein KpsC/LpsZ
MPLRLAVRRNIPVFQTNLTHIYRMGRKNLFAYNDFFHFPERFAALPEDIQEAGIKLAEARIQRRFAGEVGVDMAYSTKSAYGKARHDRLLRESSKKKILIATHCFFDSPHSYGKNTFPDFYEWLDFLGKMSEWTDYDWYIKTHPDFLPGTKEIIDNFVERYPKFTLLPSDASHMQIIAEGIDLALTSYGTIGFEYAALGVMVINASMNNPHIAYNFNLHARDVEHYRELLENLEGFNFRIDRRAIYEYYFMRYIYNTENLFFKDYNKAMAEISGYDSQFTPMVYEKWLNEWSLQRHIEIAKALHDFISSGEFRMDYTFYGREFSVASLGVTT